MNEFVVFVMGFVSAVVTLAAIEMWSISKDGEE